MQCNYLQIYLFYNLSKNGQICIKSIILMLTYSRNLLIFELRTRHVWKYFLRNSNFLQNFELWHSHLAYNISPFMNF